MSGYQDNTKPCGEADQRCPTVGEVGGPDSNQAEQRRHCGKDSPSHHRNREQSPTLEGPCVDHGDPVRISFYEPAVGLDLSNSWPEARAGQPAIVLQGQLSSREALFDRVSIHVLKYRYGAASATNDRTQGFVLVMEDLTRALADDLDATFPTVVDQMGSRLFWGLRRICGDHQEAEDLTQETFIRAYRALDGYESSRIMELKLQPWLWTIAMNLGRNHLRDRSRRPTAVEMFDSGVDDPEPVDGVAWDRRLSKLSGPQRHAVVLRHVVGLSIGEISEATSRPEGTVKADIHRGLARLRTTIEEES